MMMMMTTTNNNSDSERHIDDENDDDDDNHSNTRGGRNNIDDNSNNTEDGDDEIIQTGGICSGGFICGYVMDITKDLYHSSGLVINNKLNWLLIMGPIALLGDATGLLGETACFAFSGIALIPCAERLSFVTEQVAEHTNGTIGALLNATFGNAPELLIASAALRKGFYRVVQLAMLGSMLTNLLFVFGVSCLIGGLRWQVQELRITSGNVSVGMLLLSVAGSLLPATLILGGQLKKSSSSSSSDSNSGGGDYDDDTSIITQGFSSSSSGTPSLEELQFCRVNAFVMIFMYGCYLIFQLGTHKEEFDEDENVVQTANHTQLHLSPHFTSRHGRQPRRNVFCVWAVRRTRCFLRMSGSNNDNNREQGWVASPSITAERRGGGSGSGGENNGGDVEMMYSDRLLRMIPRDDKNNNNSIRYSDDDEEDESSSDEECLLPQNATLNQDRDNGYFDDYDTASSSAAEPRLRSRGGSNAGDGARKQHSLSPRRDNNTQQLNNNNNKTSSSNKGKKKKKKNRTPGVLLPLGLAEPSETIQRALPSLPNLDLNDSNHHHHHHHHPRSSSEPQMSFRVGILWLFIITCGVSAMSDILVDTIDGFAIRLRISEVFTSMVIVPFFSNVAEQVSAILFAYRNEMDLAVGVTVGSAIQVASFVLPGCVIMGWLFDRSMTLYFHAYETVSLFLAVIVVAAVLQGGTTNWLVGATCISVYVMIATGFWFHTLEDLSVDAEATLTGLNNATRALLSTS